MGFLSCNLRPGRTCTLTVLAVLLCVSCCDDGVNGPDPDEPTCSVAPSSIDFGALETGEFVDTTVTITNTGNITFICCFDVGSRHYRLFGTGGVDTLDRNEDIDITIRFCPDTLGTVPCTVKTGGACRDITCTGVGFETSLCDIEPSILDFGSLVVGGHADRSFVLKNNGDGVIRGSIDGGGGNYTVLTGGGVYELRAGESVTVTVRYEPLDAGTHVEWIETGTATCLDVTCTGTGEYVWRKLESGTDEDLHGVWGASANDVVAVGANGTIARFDGASWDRIGSGTTMPLYDVWGTAGYDIFVVGASRTLLHHNGYSWGFMNNPAGGSILGIGGSAWNDVLAVGNGAIHYDGSEWNVSLQTGRTLTDIWVHSRTNAFAVDTSGAVLRFDGENWSQLDAGIQSRLNGVWASSPDNLYVVGVDGNIYHYDGTKWLRKFTTLYSDLNAVWGSGPDDVYAVGQYFTVMHYDGTEWEMILRDGTWQDYFYAVWGSGRGDVFMVGTGGAVYHYGADIE